jgi:hypothetical protein
MSRKKLCSLEDNVFALNRFDDREQDLKDKVHQSLLGKCEIDPVTHCWIFTGTWDDVGLGKMRVGQRLYGTHRVSLWLFDRGYDLWEETRVVHAKCCPNLACFNPEHLERVPDQAAALRRQADLGRLGKTTGRLLSYDKARSMRALAAEGMPPADIASLMKCSRKAVMEVLNNKVYRGEAGRAGPASLAFPGDPDGRDVGSAGGEARVVDRARLHAPDPEGPAAEEPGPRLHEPAVRGPTLLR